MDNDELKDWLHKELGTITGQMLAGFDRINKRLDALSEDVNALVSLHSNDFFDFYKKHKGISPNPHPDQEKQYLLERFENGNITYDEALRLREILEQEKSEAFAKGVLAGLAVTGLLVLLGVIIEALRRQSKASGR